MPVAVINKILKKTDNVSRKELEQDWKSAKSAAQDQYGKDGDKTWGTTMKIFKNKIKKHYGIDYNRIKSKKKKNEGMIIKFSDFINEDFFVDIKQGYEFIDEIEPYFDDGYEVDYTAKKLDLPIDIVQDTYNRLSYPNLVMPLDD